MYDQAQKKTKEREHFLELMLGCSHLKASGTPPFECFVRSSLLYPHPEASATISVVDYLPLTDTRGSSCLAPPFEEWDTPNG